MNLMLELPYRLLPGFFQAGESKVELPGQGGGQKRRPVPGEIPIR